MFANFNLYKVRLAEVEISYAIGGSGPPVLLLHGFPQNKALWAEVAPILANSFTVICSDLRGYGDSSKPRALAGSTNYSFRAMAQDQLNLMQHLGFDQFHVIGHDRGGRTAFRLSLDHPKSILSLGVLDIVPTLDMFENMNKCLSQTYWHWQFLALTEPFPERLIAADPDYFYETCLVGWGAAKIDDFNPKQLTEYRRTWRSDAAIHASCSDYRAAATIDLGDDQKDKDKIVTCPVLAFYGAHGAMAQIFDIPSHWRKYCTHVQEASLPGGHFFIDQHPRETAKILHNFLERGGLDKVTV